MKIQFHNPIVELSGDEMAQVMWVWIKEKLITRFFEGPLISFDLSIQNRDATEDQVTVEAAEAIKKHRVGVKCATITPDESRVTEFNLKNMWPSPNGTIRNILNGTVFREPIVVDKIPRLVRSWSRPIVIARHAFGDQYKAFELKVPAGQQPKISLNGEFSPFKFESDGVFLAIHNKRDSIEGFARSVFNYSLQRNLNCYFSTKNTILKVYDGFFKSIFEEVFENDFKEQFAKAGLNFEHRLIDDMVAWVLKSEGGFVWALKNYDGDVQSDFVAQGFGSLGLMTSVLLTPDGRVVETEAAHGTVTRHYRLWQKGEKVSTNPIASIFAWTRAFYNRGLFDDNKDLINASRRLEDSVLNLVNRGIMTKDLALLTGTQDFVSTEEFLEAVASDFESAL